MPKLPIINKKKEIVAYTEVDPDVYAELEGKSICLMRSGCMEYASFSMKGAEKTRQVRLHTYIMRPRKGFCVDHINRNPLDNRRVNLRVVTTAENAVNRGPNRNAACAYKGVSVSPRGNKRFQAKIRARLIGAFETAEEAARAYDAAALALWGPLVYLNFPAEHPAPGPGSELDGLPLGL